MYQICKDVFWTGYIDWDLRVFHGYSTPSGSTYNSYLIMDEQPTLIDTVKHYGADDMMAKIREVIDPAKIRYVIANHAEMDHSGSLEQILAAAPDAELVCSVKAVDILRKHFKKDWRFRPVQDGETLRIGQRELTFLHMPMVHWPESMATYSAQDQILFSNDAFGQHYASEERCVDEVDVEMILTEAAKYYANIVLPYGAQVQRVLAAASKLKIAKICPSHGLLWRDAKQIQRILECYARWAGHQTDAGQVLVVYDTMWHSTETMAKALAAALEQEGLTVRLRDLQQTHISDVMTDVLDCRMILVGTPMLNNRMLPTMASFLMYLKGLKPKDRLAFAFGSYGWSKIGFKEVEQFLTEAGMTLAAEGRHIQYVPDPDELQALLTVVPELQSRLQG